MRYNRGIVYVALILCLRTAYAIWYTFCTWSLRQKFDAAKEGITMKGYEFRRIARDFMRANSPKIYIISIIYLIISTVLNQLQYRLADIDNAYEQITLQINSGVFPDLISIVSYLRPSGIPFAIAVWILITLINVGYMSYALKISRAQEADQRDLFDGFLFFGKIVAIQLLEILFIFLWSLFFIFPGLTAAYSYKQAYFILLDDPSKSPLDCLRESKQLMQGQKLNLFLLEFSFLGWLILDHMATIMMIMMGFPIALPIVLIYLAPYINVACAGFYNRLVLSLTV